MIQSIGDRLRRDLGGHNEQTNLENFRSFPGLFVGIKEYPRSARSKSK